MPTILNGSGTASPSYLAYDWERSPRDPVSHKLSYKSNRMSRRAASIVWHPEYQSGNPGMLYLLGRSSTSEYRNELGSSPYARAYAKFREAAWSDAQASLSVDAAEGRKTLQMITQTLTRLGKAALAVRKGQFEKAGHLLLSGKPKGVSVAETFASNWLAYRLGWTPFIKSLDSLVQTLGRPLQFEFRFCRGSSSLPFNVVKKAGAVSYWHDITLSGVYRVTIKARVEVSDPNLARLNQLGLLNPLEVAWELIPFSFMVDRIIRIGDFLSYWDDFVGLSFSDLSITEAITSSELWTVGRAGWKPVGDQHIKALIKRKSRSLASSLPVPSLQMGKGLFDNAKHAADAAALLIQLLRR